jgi:hypothetical protein
MTVWGLKRHAAPTDVSTSSRPYLSLSCENFQIQLRRAGGQVLERVAQLELRAGSGPGRAGRVPPTHHGHQREHDQNAVGVQGRGIQDLGEGAAEEEEEVEPERL